MKTQRVIDQIEKTLPDTMRRCRYCGSAASVYIRADKNYRGDEGFVATVRCSGCFASVFAFGSDEKSAEIKARSCWERGIYDG